MRVDATRPLPWVCAAFAAVALAGSAIAVPAAVASQRNVYMAGGEVHPAQPIAGDLMAAGGRIVLSQPVGGDATLAAGSIDVSGPVMDDLRVVGGSIRIGSRVGADVFAAGADITLGPDAQVGGTAELNAANIVVQGRLQGALRGRAQKILIDGEVLGPTYLAAERIELGAKARIGGPLTYASPAEMTRADGAVVSATVTREATGTQQPRPAASRTASGVSGPGFVVVALALLASCALFLFILPGPTSSAAARLWAAPWASLGWGLLAVLAVPPIACLLFVTILGIPLGLALMAALPVLLLAGFAIAVLALTRLVPASSPRPGQAGRPPLRLGHFTLVLLAVLLLGLVPVAGAVFMGLLALAGAGAAVWQIGTRRVPAAPADASSELPPLPGRDVFPA